LAVSLYPTVHDHAATTSIDNYGYIELHRYINPFVNEPGEHPTISFTDNPREPHQNNSDEPCQIIKGRRITADAFILRRNDHGRFTPVLEHDDDERSIPSPSPSRPSTIANDTPALKWSRTKDQFEIRYGAVYRKKPVIVANA